jgi:very-short-patch-repair endonuclease
LDFSFGPSEGPRPSADASATARTRLLALLHYIEQVERLHRRPTLVVPVEFYCAFEEELLDLPGVERHAVADGDDLWLRVACLEPHDPPAPAEVLQPWIVLSKSPDQTPRLREELTLPSPEDDSPPITLRRADQPRVGPAFDRYVSGEWASWAGFERVRRKTMTAYDRLFALHQSMEAEGAEMPLELVWGIGMAVWNHGGEHRIAHPVLTQAVEIGLDRATLALEIRPRNRAPSLELEPYVGLASAATLGQLEQAWRTHQEGMHGTLSPHDRGSFEPFLKDTLAILDSEGQYWPAVNPAPQDRSLPAFQRQLVITDGWVLFARKRSPNALIEDVERLRESLAEAAEVPPGAACFVSEPSNRPAAPADLVFRGFGSFGAPPAGGPVRELFFPKPYNAEQVSILQKLEASPGVVVQGPPGTGKTHTIANIICHTLAQGGRVLVTSKGEPALAVLRDHIPESLRPLSVSLLTEEKEGIQQFKRAIHSIAAAVARIDPAELARTLAGIRSHVDGLHGRLAELDRDIAACAELQLRRVQFCGRFMLPLELARHVRERENEYAWFPDKLQDGAPAADFAEPGITHADIDAARAARRALGAQLTMMQESLPRPDELPDAAVLARIHEALQRHRRVSSAMQAEALPSLREEAADPATGLNELLDLVRQAMRLHGRSDGAALAEQARRSREQRAQRDGLEQLERLADAAEQLDRERAPFLLRPVEAAAGTEIDAEFVQAIRRASTGKNPFGVLPFGRGGLRSQVHELRVAGLPPQTAGDWQHVLDFLEFRRKARALAAQWQALSAELQLPAPRANDVLQALRPHAELARAVRTLVAGLEPRISALTLELFGYETASANPPETADALAFLRDLASRHLDRLRDGDAGRFLNEVAARLGAARGPMGTRLQRFLSSAFGDDRYSPANIVAEWTALLEELRALQSLRPAFATLRAVASRAEQAGAPLWANALLSEPVTGSTDPWTPLDWWEAWHWRQAATFFELADSRDRVTQLQAERREKELDLARSYQSLIEHSTWLQIHRNSPPAVTAALQAYLNAVQHIGKGLGVRAARYRREARTAMLTAHRAVPCWIMPHWRVSETLPSEIGQFDLVILDEASQSDLWALPCLLRGKKLIIVGDDRQVSPEAIGLGEERIRDLRERYLKTQVFGDQMTPEKSIYELARVAFSGNLVMLREHFRCARPIIEFSKREFYQHDLQPLRVPRASERLVPPLIDVHIKGARRRGNVNEAEARALVNEIKLVIADPRCAGRSIGVVSLLGTDQARAIFRILREEVSAKEILARRITVGDARTFQGKERDIMLLSMVATPDAKVTATSATFQQRFNVAASRARDQMILFRSVDTSDLNETDLKAKLIAHFCSPFSGPAAAREERDRCESAFERELYDELRSRGYRVLAKVPAGADAIDLVVEGDSDRRLAIECDGDQYHGAPQWAAHMARQRVLERAGWTVWRGFASAFTLRRRAMLDELLALLRELGIEPGTRSGAAAHAYTEHRVIQALDILEAPPVSLFSA